MCEDPKDQAEDTTEALLTFSGDDRNTRNKDLDIYEDQKIEDERGVSGLEARLHELDEQENHDKEEFRASVYMYVGEAEECEGEGNEGRVVLMKLGENERRGWWREHELAEGNATQVFVDGAVNDEPLPVMLDTGANVSIVHSDLIKALGVKVRMFDNKRNFYGVSDSPLAAVGKAIVKIRIGGHVVFEVEVWVGAFGARSMIILGTDFMIKAGLRIDMMSRECALPYEEPVAMLMRSELDSSKWTLLHERVRKGKHRQFQVDLSNVPAVATIGDAFPEIFTLEGVDPTSVNQSSLAEEVLLHEGVEMSVEDMQNQLALIPEFSDEPPGEVDLSTADIGEEENTPEELDQLREVLKEGQFCSSGNALPPPAKGVVCDIEVNSTEVVNERARRVPPHIMGRLYELMRGLLRAGLARHSRSSWASPIVIVLKKNGVDIRLCVDYRRVNMLTTLMIYAMPLIEDLLDGFHAVMWMCSLDNASGFWAVPLTKRARLITAFICPLGHFEWLRMPQGFKNAPQIYQRIIDNCLWATVRCLSSQGKNVKFVGYEAEEMKELAGDMKGEDVSTDVKLEADAFHSAEVAPTETRPILYRRSYIDDINFGSNSWTEMCDMLRALFASFKEWGISISLPKSAFGKKSVEFLSHTVSREGIKSSPRNLDAVMKMPFPSTMKGVQKFLGSLNYYHRFINNFATYAGALYELTDARLRDGTQLEHAKNAFEALKKMLCQAPLLKHMDRKRPVSVILYTNAWAYGAAVCQDHEGVLHPVRFYSKVFQDNERGYLPAEKEVLALLKTLEAAMDIFAGQEITVYARYSTMKWVFTSKSLTGRAVQWGALLSPWTLKIIRSDKTPSALVAMLAASITPPEELDSVLDEISPMKIVKPTTLIAPMPNLRRSTEGFAITFDGAVRTKDPKLGSFGAVLWSLPAWTVVAAEYGVSPGSTVNDSEYQGLICGLELALKYEAMTLVVCGDSRIIVGQVNGDLRCHQPNLVVWLERARNLVAKFDKVHLLHVARKFNQSADLLTRRAMNEEKGGVIETDGDKQALQLLNSLPDLLYSTADDELRAEPGQGEVFAVDSDDHERTEVFVVTRSRMKRKILTPRVFVEELEQSAKEEDAEDRTNEEWSPLHVAVEELVAAKKERFRRIAMAQEQDSWCKRIIEYLTNGDVESLPDDTDGTRRKRLKKLIRQSDAFVLDQNHVLYYHPPRGRRQVSRAPRLVVPEMIKDDVLHAYHAGLAAGAHQGVGRTFEKLRDKYYWKGMFADVENYVASCTDCSTGKGKPRYQGTSEGNISADRPSQIVTMDFATPLPMTPRGNTALLLFTCLFSGFIILVPVTGTTTDATADAYLEYVLKRFGAQEVLRHDRDPAFVSSVFRRFSRMMKHKQRPTLAYRPQANGKQERNVQTVIRAIKLYIEEPEQRDWDLYVPRLELALNTSVNLQLKQSSFYLVHGWHPRTMLDASIPPKDGTKKEMDAFGWRRDVCKAHEYAMHHAAEIQKKLVRDRAEAHNKELADATGVNAKTEYAVGEWVWLYHSLVKKGLARKLAHLWHGPFEVEKKVSDVAYQLKMPDPKSRAYPVVHISRLKPYVSRVERPTERLDDSAVAEVLDESLLPEDSWEPDGADGEYEVEEILDDRSVPTTRNGRQLKEYLVKWVGYEDPTWEPEDNLSCMALMYEYDSRRAKERRALAAQTADGDEGSEDEEEIREVDESRNET